MGVWWRKPRAGQIVYCCGCDRALLFLPHQRKRLDDLEHDLLALVVARHEQHNGCSMAGTIRAPSYQCRCPAPKPVIQDIALMCGKCEAVIIDEKPCRSNELLKQFAADMEAMEDSDAKRVRALVDPAWDDFGANVRVKRFARAGRRRRSATSVEA